MRQRATNRPADKDPQEPAKDIQVGLQRGDRKTYERVYREHVEDVMQLLRGGFGYRTASGERGYVRVRSTFDAEDLCQEAFRAFFVQCERGTFDTSRPALPYIRRIAANMAVRHIGRSSRETIQPDIDPEPPPAEDPAVAAEVRKMVGGFKASLSEQERRVVDLYFGDGRSQADVAQRTSLSRDQVYRLLVKIRGRARVWFRARGWFDEP